MPLPYITNPFAPSGLAVPPAMGLHEESGIYVFAATLTALQSRPNLEVSIDTDSDFYLKGLVRSPTTTGAFQFQFADESGYFTSNAYIESVALPTSFALPWPVTPQLRFSAGGRITWNLIDTSNAGNDVVIYCLGTKRFLKPR